VKLIQKIYEVLEQVRDFQFLIIPTLVLAGIFMGFTEGMSPFTRIAFVVSGALALLAYLVYRIIRRRRVDHAHETEQE
jgi:hypothetical protein